MTKIVGPIQFKRAKTTGVVPLAGELVDGQPFVNLADYKIFLKNTAGAVKDFVAEHPDVKVAKANAASALASVETKAETSTVSALSATVSALTTGAPGGLDTFLEAYNRFLTNEEAVAGKADATDLTSHTSDTSNPHNVTKSQVGLGNVNNTTDADKPISSAMQTALDEKLDISDFDTALNAAVVATPTRDDAPTSKAYVLTQIANVASGGAFEEAVASKLDIADFDATLADAVVPTPTRDDAPVNRAYVVAQVAAAGTAQTLSLTAHPSAAVAADRLLWVDEDGKVGEVNPAYGYMSYPNFNDLATSPNMHAMSNSNQGGASSDANANSSYSPGCYPMDFPCIAELTNGNVVMVRNSGNYPNIYKPKVCIMDRITGATVVAWTTVSTTVADQAHTVRVHALTTGGFVVAYADPGVNGSIRAAIYDNAGAVVMADASLFTHPNNYANNQNGYAWAVQPLAGGKWAIVCNDGDTTAGAAKVMLRIYSATGSVVSAAAQIGSMAGTYYTLGIGIALMANGDFVVTAWGQYSMSVARLTDAGALVGSVQTPASQAALAPSYDTMSPHAGICELDNGSVAVSFKGSSDNYGRVAIINAGFTSILATVAPGGPVQYWTTATGKILALCRIAGGFIIASTGGYVLAYANDGSLLKGPAATQYVAPDMSASNSGFRSIKRGALSTRATIFTAYFDGSSALYYISRFSTTTFTYDRNTQVAVGTWSQGGGSAFILRADDMPLLSMSLGNYRAYFNPMPGLRSLIGVSKAAAAAGAAIDIGAQGNFTLSHTFAVVGGSGWGYRWDHRAKTLPGSIGVVYGDKAILNGLF